MSNAIERLKKRQNDSGCRNSVLDALAPITQGDIVYLPSGRLHDFAGHTFKTRPASDPYICSLSESIKSNGILEPILVRPHPTIAGDYEIIAGHTRERLGLDIGITDFPCVIKEMDDDEAILYMGETNIQRPDWLASEKARTYRAHLEALRRTWEKKAGRPSKQTSGNNSGTKFPNYPAERLRDLAAQRWGISGRMFDVYLKLNDLTPDLLELVDEKRINVKGGYHLSCLPPPVQADLYNLLCEYPDITVSESKAIDLRRVEQEKWLKVLGIERESRPQGETMWGGMSLPHATVRKLRQYQSDPVFSERLIAFIDQYHSDTQKERE